MSFGHDGAVDASHQHHSYSHADQQAHHAGPQSQHHVVEEEEVAETVERSPGDESKKALRRWVSAPTAEP